MIASLNGILISKSPTEVVLDVHGVGYSVSIPLSTFERLGLLNSPIVLLTYLHVREDSLQLFGFSTEEERSLFRLLISVSGIGPKMAQGILSGITAGDLKSHIMHGNIGGLTTIPGVGKKLGERLVVELRDKIGKLEMGTAVSGPEPDEQSRIRSETLLALISLGYSRASAERALQAALQETNGKQCTVEELIKSSLRHATK
jgi:Holliday junction DNA helicase RuvA